MLATTEKDKNLLFDLEVFLVNLEIGWVGLFVALNDDWVELFSGLLVWLEREYLWRIILLQNSANNIAAAGIIGKT